MPEEDGSGEIAGRRKTRRSSPSEELPEWMNVRVLQTTTMGGCAAGHRLGLAALDQCGVLGAACWAAGVGVHQKEMPGER